MLFRVGATLAVAHRPGRGGSALMHSISRDGRKGRPYAPITAPDGTPGTAFPTILSEVISCPVPKLQFSPICA